MLSACRPSLNVRCGPFPSLNCRAARLGAHSIHVALRMGHERGQGTNLGCLVALAFCRSRHAGLTVRDRQARGQILTREHPMIRLLYVVALCPGLLATWPS